MTYPLTEVGDIVEWQTKPDVLNLTRKQKKILKRLDHNIVAVFIDPSEGQIVLGTATGENLIRKQQEEDAANTKDTHAHRNRDNSPFARALELMNKEES